MTGHRRDGSSATGHLGLCTDLYELRMAASYLRRDMTAMATFSLFLRSSPARPWYVAVGVERVLELLTAFAYGPAELAELERIGIDAATRAALGDLPLTTGEVWAVADGTVVLADEPILELTAPLPFAQLLETAVMNLVQFPTLIATKAARCALVADGRLLADFGFRRAHGLETGVEAALAAYLGGGFSTSNVEAGRRYGIPITGTMAHSYVQAFVDEREAFRTFALDHPDHSILLVDTYDTLQGVRRAIDVCHELGITPQGIRLDSGDLGPLAVEARRLLDDAGFDSTRIIASGGLDEVAIHELVTAGAPIDGFGVGTALTVSEDHPGLDIVYKLVEYDGRPVAKFSGTKATYPGRKQVRRTDRGPTTDVLDIRGTEPDTPGLLRPIWRDGERTLGAFDIAEVRERVAAEVARLPTTWRRPPYPAAVPRPRVSRRLHEGTERLRRELGLLMADA